MPVINEVKAPSHINNLRKPQRQFLYYVCQFPDIAMKISSLPLDFAMSQAISKAGHYFFLLPGPQARSAQCSPQCRQCAKRKTNDADRGKRIVFNTLKVLTQQRMAQYTKFQAANVPIHIDDTMTLLLASSAPLIAADAPSLETTAQ